MTTFLGFTTGLFAGVMVGFFCKNLHWSIRTYGEKGTHQDYVEELAEIDRD